MIYGFGTDIIEIARIKKAMERPHFCERVFSEEERQELTEKKAESAAACFCAKEAFSKALGTGIRGFRLCEVSLLHKENGQPYLFLSGSAKQLAEQLHIYAFHLSVSHTKTIATCSVIAEQQ